MTALASLPIERPTAAVLAEAAEGIEAPAQTALLEGETVRFRERGVALTERHAQLNFKIYPLHAIYGASLRELPHSQSVIYGLILFGSLLAMLITPVSFLWAVVTAGGSGLIALSLRLAVRTNHILRITTPHGEVDALQSHDRRYLLRVFEALNTALGEVHR